MKTDLSQIGETVETLNGRADELLEKLSKASELLTTIQEQCDKLPSKDDWIDYCRFMPSGDDLRQFAESWADLPSIDELCDFSKALPSANDLEGFSESWTNLPDIEEVLQYSSAASGISAGLKAAE